jgi:DNA-binding transcriptional MerR regulator
MRIGELASAAGVGVETIRYYERRGLLAPPSRTAARYRVFGDEDLIRVRFIRRAKRLGFGLGEIAELLELRDDQSTTCAEVGRRAAAKLVNLDCRMRELDTFRRALASLAASCGKAAEPGSCALLHHLGDPEEREPNG